MGSRLSSGSSNSGPDSSDVTPFILWQHVLAVLAASLSLEVGKKCFRKSSCSSGVAFSVSEGRILLMRGFPFSNFSALPSWGGSPDVAPSCRFTLERDLLGRLRGGCVLFWSVQCCDQHFFLSVQ